MSQGRPRKFDETEVVERAMDLFWSRGYEAVGLSELVDHMGISRQSLYSTFGNKRGLFIRTIERYRETQLIQALDLLEREGSRIDNVKAVVSFFESLATDKRCRGCLVANTLVEMGPHDEEIASLLEDTLDLLQKGIERALTEAQAEGELAPGKSPLQISRAITNAVIGLAVTGKLRPGAAALRDIYSGTLSMLD